MSLITPGISQDETCELIEPYLRLGAHPTFLFHWLSPPTVIWIKVLMQILPKTGDLGNMQCGELKII